MLNFKECKVSGQIRAIGKKGDYWIDDSAWIYLTVVKITEKGPSMYRDTYHSIEDAKAEAERLEAV